MAELTLFCPCNTASGDHVFFDYQHDDRSMVVVSVNIEKMTLNYRNCSGVWTGEHGSCVEMNSFDGIFVGKEGVHQILFQGLSAPHGHPQDLLFSQIGAYAWKATHRTGAGVTISLQRPGSRYLHIEPLPDDCVLPDVIALGECVRENVLQRPLHPGLHPDVIAPVECGSGDESEYTLA